MATLEKVSFDPFLEKVDYDPFGEEPAEAITLEEPGIEKPSIVSGALETLQSIGKLYPVAETAAEMVTSTYGVPLSGLAGLFALPLGLEKAEGVMEATQKALVYKPQTESGQQLSGAATYPIQKLESVGEAAGETLSEFGYPNLAAAAHTAIVGAPAVLGAKTAIGKSPTRVPAVLDKKINSAINKGINKAIRPSVVGKRTSTQAKGYYDKARTAVQEIVKNKDNMTLLDSQGNVSKGLPKTLNEFSQAIEQTKRNVFSEYDALAQEAGRQGIKIDLDKSASKIKPVIKNKVLEDFSPETIEYASKRIESLQGRAEYTALETQEAIQLLNQSMEKFYRDPSPQLKGQAFVDSLIANDLRKQLDTSISKATGKNYQGLKKKYGALKTIEKDVNHRAIVDARKNNKGLIDFSDVFSGHQIISGMLRADPAAMAGGAAAKSVSSYFKMLNDPNRIVKTMFSDVEKISNKQK
jgi:hypothetical protein